VTDIKIDPKVTAAVGDGLAPFVDRMFARQDGRWVALIEIKHVRREEPGAGEDKAPVVKLRLTHLEIAPDEHEDKIRELLRVLYKLRTAQGTLDDADILEHQVLPDRLKYAVDTMLWPPQPGDVWMAGEGDHAEPWFAFVNDDGGVVMTDSLGQIATHTELFARTQRMDLKARKRVRKGDDSA
jgi:hypothetical protein